MPINNRYIDLGAINILLYGAPPKIIDTVEEGFGYATRECRGDRGEIVGYGVEIISAIGEKLFYIRHFLLTPRVDEVM